MDWKLYFRFAGRANRAKFWRLFIIAKVWVILGLMFSAAIRVAAERKLVPLPMDRLSDVVVVFVVVVYLWLLSSTFVRRLHDIDTSAWWLIVAFGLPFLFSITGSNAAVGLASIAALAICGSVNGTEGDNHFGPDPLGRQNPQKLTDQKNEAQTKTALDCARRLLETKFVDDAKALIEALEGTISYIEKGVIFSKLGILVHVFGERRLFNSEYEMVQWIAKEVAPKVVEGRATGK
jgi:uncharacterized membrane protein YhaH (DUF805 family)